MTHQNHNHRKILQQIARQAMLDRGLLPDFSTSVFNELKKLEASQHSSHPDGKLQDMRGMLWASIDNDDSMDIDQLTVAEQLSDNQVRIYVSIADVDALVKKDTAIDGHAHHNTTSVYTPAIIFAMLPEVLSTDLTSLGFNDDRPSIIVEMTLSVDGSLVNSDVYSGLVKNKAKLAYNSVAAWLEGKSEVPDKVSQVAGLQENLLLQDRVAQQIKEFRHQHGALSFETLESKPIFSGDQIIALQAESKNRAKDIVENFMIAANGVTARFLTTRNYPSIRRVVSIPQRWDRIISIASEHNYRLPNQPDARALEDFLVSQKKSDPLRFPDLSLSIIKLLGAGQYTATPPDTNQPGHFSLAVKDYGHSTAPNRRFTDLVTQRLLKAAINDHPQPYKLIELQAIAEHCTQAENAVNKVERQVEKSAAAMLLEDRIGEKFNAMITGAAEKGTWVRLLSFPIEGKLISGRNHYDVGDRLQVRLDSVNIEKGYIDFSAIH